MKFQALLLWTAAVTMFGTSHVQAALMAPQVGWQAELSQEAHNVSGSVTIVDDNTIRVDDFTYDGGGIEVFFYLGQEDSRSSFSEGLEIGDDLFGSGFDGSQPPLMIDLPAEETLEGWHAVSVWCVEAGVSFGSGTFMPVDVAVPGDYNGDGTVGAADHTVWRDSLGQTGGGLAADGSGPAGEPDGVVDQFDYDNWKTQYGNSAADNQASRGLPANGTIPEPATALLIGLAVIVFPERVRRLML